MVWPGRVVLQVQQLCFWEEFLHALHVPTQAIPLPFVQKKQGCIWRPGGWAGMHAGTGCRHGAEVPLLEYLGAKSCCLLRFLRTQGPAPHPWHPGGRQENFEAFLKTPCLPGSCPGPGPASSAMGRLEARDSGGTAKGPPQDNHPPGPTCQPRSPGELSSALKVPHTTTLPPHTCHAHSGTPKVPRSPPPYHRRPVTLPTGQGNMHAKPQPQCTSPATAPTQPACLTLTRRKRRPRPHA